MSDKLATEIAAPSH